MIYDRVNRLSHYRPLHPLLARAIDYATTADLASLAVGRHDIAGGDLYVAVHEYQTKPAELARFEAHRRYVDLQIVLAGREAMDVVDIDDATVSEPYTDSTDNVFFARPANAQRLVVSEGEFAIFLPHDVHAPTISVGEISMVRKVVFKIRAWQ